MKLAAAACCLALAIAAQEAAPPVEPDWVAKLPPRKPIAGLAGFHSISRIVYTEAPGLPHVLETTYVFRDRVRWYLALVDGEPGDRHIDYRCGSTYFELKENSARSTRFGLGDDEINVRELTFAAMELRRALFLWPDGDDWSRGATRAASRGEFGVVEGVLDASGRLSVLRFQDRDLGGESYRSVEWREHRGRWWPASMELWHGDTKVWTEHVDSVETSIHVLDEFFVPPDRRTRSPASTAASEIAPLDVAAGAVSRSALADGADWPAALARAKAWRTDARERAAKAKRETEPALLIEIDQDGRARAVLARLTGDDGALPDGFAAAAARRALSRWVALDASAIEATAAELRARLPAGARALAAYVRVPAPDAPDPFAQVVQPYEPPP